MTKFYKEVELTTKNDIAQAEDSMVQEKKFDVKELIPNLLKEAEAILGTFDWWEKNHPFLQYLNELDKTDLNSLTDLNRLMNILKLNSCLESIFFLDAKHRIDSKLCDTVNNTVNSKESLSSVLNKFIKVAIFKEGNSPAIDYAAIEQTLYWDIWLKTLSLLAMNAVIALAGVFVIMAIAKDAPVIFTLVIAAWLAQALNMSLRGTWHSFQGLINQSDNIKDLVKLIETDYLKDINKEPLEGVYQDSPSGTLSI